MRRLASAAACLALIAGCAGGADESTGTTTAGADGSSTTSAPTGPAAPSPSAGTAGAASAGALPAVRLVDVASVDAGTAIATRAGDSAVYVTEQAGRVLAVREGRLDPAPVLDLTDEVLSGGERGLLGIAFSADGRTLYAYWTAKQPVGQITIASFPMADATAASPQKTVLVTVDHAKYGNHNGGILQLGPDGFLYAGIGDGGSGGDPDGNGQSTGTLLGKVIRIDPTKPEGGRPYGIPPGNPFANGGGRPEIWAYGLRNPWRLSFDPPTDSLWIADVGQNAYEEVNRVAAGTPGVNYGWKLREGLHAFRGGDRPARAVDPVAELSHDDGACSITGGHVYRGAAIPGLVGRYVFADFCQSALRALTESGGRWTIGALNAQAAGVRTFGLDPAGELLLLDSRGLRRLAPA